MKKILLSMALLATTATAIAQSEIVIGTALPYGETLTFECETANSADSVYVDWGDGKRVSYKKGRNSWNSNTYVSGKLLNDTIHVYGSLAQLNIDGSQYGDSLTVLQFKNQSKLTKLYASNNKLTNDGLDLSGATNLEIIELSKNNLTNLNLIPFDKLQIFSVNDNPEFNTAVFANGNSNLNNISMNNCDIVHFYPISLPNLYYLNIANGSLMDIEIADHYPNLSSLNLTGNKMLTSVNVTGCPDLYALSLANTGITDVNIASNPSLNSIDISHTNVKTLDLSKNTALNSINVSNTLISKLDVSKITGLKTINIDSTSIARLDLTKKRFLQYVYAKNTQIEFLDMHNAIGYNRLKMLDIRNNKNMTAQTLNFTFDAMPPHEGESYGTNVWIAGSNGEHANTNLLAYDAENSYNVDVEGDGTASMDSVDITTPAVEGGTYSLTQVGDYGSDDSWHAITTKAKPGYPISVQAVPAEGYHYVGVMVGDKLYNDTICVTSVPNTIKAVFEANSNEQVIKLTVPNGAAQQYAIGGRYSGDKITVDWGDGNPVEYTLTNSTTPVYNDNGTKGTTVTITGPVRYLDLSSYPGVATDNKISALDITGNDSLRSLLTYMNEAIGSIDVSNEPNLEELDASYTGLTALNIANNPKLTKLYAYGNELTSVNLSTAPDLVDVNLKNNQLESIDLSKNPKIQKLQLQNNAIEDINVSNLTALGFFEAQGNYISDIDLSKNTQLYDLNLSDNMLETLDLSNNKQLLELYVSGNNLAPLDLSGNTSLLYVNVSNNGWTACDLNDFYWNLPEWKLPAGVNPDDLDLKTTLWAQGNSTSSKTQNDAAHAESLIATGKGWTVNIKGDATGCDSVYVKVLPYENGTVRLYTTDDKEIFSGSKVKKNTAVTVTATPAEGYIVKSRKANGEDFTDSFSPKVYTEVLVEFSLASAIDAIGNTTNVTIKGGNRELDITAGSTIKVKVYSLNGNNVYDGEITGNQAIGLPSGVYIVKTGGVSKAILVK